MISARLSYNVALKKIENANHINLTQETGGKELLTDPDQPDRGINTDHNLDRYREFQISIVNDNPFALKNGGRFVIDMMHFSGKILSTMSFKLPQIPALNNTLFTV